VRAAVAGAGAGSATLAAGALATGPLAPAWELGVVWALATLACILAAGYALQPLRGLLGGGAARLLSPIRRDLISPLRSAYELAQHGGGPGTSSALIEAHAAHLRAELAKLPPRRVVPARWVRHPSVAAGLAGMLAAGAVLLASDRAAAGAWALLHPGEHDAGGVPVAAVFRDVRARLVYPGYLEREATVVEDPTHLAAPPGTTIEMSGRTRFEARAAELEIAGTPLRMEREDERWVARFLLRADAALVLRARSANGVWVRDATVRSVHVVPDQTPRVTLLLPSADAIVEAHEAIPIAFDAQDDVGVVAADLVVRGADGREQRRRIATPERPLLDLRGDDTITMAEIGAQAGDRIEIWVEARDGDDVSGPHVGRSESRTLTLASEATRREQATEALEALLDRAIAVLADRLEQPPVAEEEPARARFSAIRTSTEALTSGLDAHAERLRARGGRRTDAVLFHEAAARVRRLLFEEMRLHGPSLGALAARQGVDARAITELEHDVLLLADVLTRARVEDAAAIARELEQLRREIASLLAELRRADTAEARSAILVAIARAEQRLADLRARMAQMGTAIPQEFANVSEGEMRQSEDALASLREALARNDLDAAQHALTRLEQQIDALARAIGAGESSFSEAHFGPRERALAEALDRLMGLEAEQRELARRTGEVRGLAARRALDAADERSVEEARRLAGRVRAVRDALGPIDRERLSSTDREAFDALLQRLRDTEDALSTGDLDEARRMAESAGDQLDELARDLELESLMFPGHDGQTARSRRAAADAQRRLRDLRAEIDQTLPDLADHVSTAERGRMKADAPRQRNVRTAAGELAERFDHGPDGNPLSPEIAAGLRDVRRSMDDAIRGLERGDPAGAARAQDEAARRLSELREQVEQDMQRSSGGGGGRDEGPAPPGLRSEVRIHGADEFSGPMDLRRRVLDAMQDAPPSGYEEAVRRYYEGLLR
jgi:hypothetical protein